MPELYQETAFGKGEPCYLFPDIDVKRTTEFKLVAASAVLLAGTLIAFSKDEIRTYSVPKTPSAVKMAANTGGIDVNPGAAVQWTTPKGWQELAPTSIRLGNLVVPGKDGKKAEVTITSFPGDVGGELGNVNRWRGELGLAPVTNEQITSKDVQVGDQTAKLYDFSSAQARTVVASLPRDGATWFFKIRGDKELVTDSIDAFLGFLKSIRFDGKAVGIAGADAAVPNPHAGLPVANGSADPHAGLAGAPADPHAGIAGAPPLNAGAADSAPAGDEPKWQVPANWKEKAPGMMVLKSFTVSNEGKDATISISQFPGDVGGTFANVNRWRAQMGLPPVAKEGLDKVTSTINVENGGKGTLVDFKGTDAKTGKPARLVAVAVPQAGNTWFYKLLGDDSVVGHEKESFVKFVEGVHY